MMSRLENMRRAWPSSPRFASSHEVTFYALVRSWIPFLHRPTGRMVRPSADKVQKRMEELQLAEVGGTVAEV